MEAFRISNHKSGNNFKIQICQIDIHTINFDSLDWKQSKEQGSNRKPNKVRLPSVGAAVTVSDGQSEDSYQLRYALFDFSKLCYLSDFRPPSFSYYKSIMDHGFGYLVILIGKLIF